MGGQHRGDGCDPVEREDRLFGRLAQRFGAGAARCGDFDGEADIAVLDCQAADHAERYQILALFGVADPAQRLQDPFFVYLRHA